MDLRIIKDGVEIDVSRLYPIKSFAEKAGFSYTTIRYRIGIGLLDFVEIAGTIFVIEPEDKEYKKRRKAGRKPSFKKQDEEE